VSTVGLVAAAAAAAVVTLGNVMAVNSAAGCRRPNSYAIISRPSAS